MKPTRSLIPAVVLASLMSAASVSAYADDKVLISDTAINDKMTVKVLAVDAANHRVTVEGDKGGQIPIQLSNQAKDLGNLKVGDTVTVNVTRSVAVEVDKDTSGYPATSIETGVIRATAANPNPNGEAFSRTKVTSKITGINMEKHEVTLMPPQGMERTVVVEDPDLQARMKNLKVGQTVDMTYTDILTITTAPPKN